MTSADDGRTKMLPRNRPNVTKGIEMNHQKAVLLVDVGYFVTYRFFAVQKYFLLNSKNRTEKYEDDHDWSSDENFVEKYQKSLFVGLSRIARRYDIPLSNVVFAVDDHRANVWRSEIYPKYKIRKPGKRQTGLSQIVDTAINHLIPDFSRANDCRCIAIDCLEGG